MSEVGDNHNARRQAVLNWAFPRRKGYPAPITTICSILTKPMTHRQGDAVPAIAGAHAERLRVLRRQKLAEVMVDYPHYVAWMSRSENRNAYALDFLMPPKSSHIVIKEHQDSIRDMQTLMTLNDQYIKSGFALSRSATESEALAVMFPELAPDEAPGSAENKVPEAVEE